jgi:hypothetical protein
MKKVKPGQVGQVVETAGVIRPVKKVRILSAGEKASVGK